MPCLAFRDAGFRASGTSPPLLRRLCVPRRLIRRRRGKIARTHVNPRAPTRASAPRCLGFWNLQSRKFYCFAIGSRAAWHHSAWFSLRAPIGWPRHCDVTVSPRSDCRYPAPSSSHRGGSALPEPPSHSLLGSAGPGRRCRRRAASQSCVCPSDYEVSRQLPGNFAWGRRSAMTPARARGRDARAATPPLGPDPGQLRPPARVRVVEKRGGSRGTDGRCGSAVPARGWAPREFPCAAGSPAPRGEAAGGDVCSLTGAAGTHTVPRPRAGRGLSELEPARPVGMNSQMRGPGKRPPGERVLSLEQNGTSLSSENLCRLAGPLGTESHGAPSLAPRGARGAGSEGTSPIPAGLSFFPFLSPPLPPGGKPASSGPLGFY